MTLVNVSFVDYLTDPRVKFRLAVIEPETCFPKLSGKLYGTRETAADNCNPMLVFSFE